MSQERVKEIIGIEVHCAIMDIGTKKLKYKILGEVNSCHPEPLEIYSLMSRLIEEDDDFIYTVRLIHNLISQLVKEERLSVYWTAYPFPLINLHPRYLSAVSKELLL